MRINSTGRIIHNMSVELKVQQYEDEWDILFYPGYVTPVQIQLIHQKAEKYLRDMFKKLVIAGEDISLEWDDEEGFVTIRGNITRSESREIIENIDYEKTQYKMSIDYKGKQVLAEVLYL